MRDLAADLGRRGLALVLGLRVVLVFLMQRGRTARVGAVRVLLPWEPCRGDGAWVGFGPA